LIINSYILVPKKPKEILDKIISENGLSKNFTEDAVSFYWSEVRRHLSNMDSPSLTVTKLGIFNIKYWKIDEFIDSYKRHLENKEPLTWKEATYRKQMEKQYENFVKIKKTMDKEFDRKLEKKEKRKQYESAKTMGEQIQDNGGTPEQRNQEG